MRAARALLGLYLLTAVAVAVQRGMIIRENNFVIFRAAFRHLVAGLNLYAAYPAEHADLFKYSPTFAFLFAPFALMPFQLAFLVWACAGAFAVWWGITRVLAPHQAALALVVSWIAVASDLQRAQSNSLCVGLMLIGFAALERRRQAGAALAIALAMFVKIFPVSAIASAALYPRRVRFGAVFALVAAALFALPIVAVRVPSLLSQYQWWYALERRDAVPLAAYGTAGAAVYAGVMGQLHVWFSVDWPHWPVQLAGLVILLSPIVFQRRGYVDPGFRLRFFTSTLVFCVLFNHQAESPTFVFAVVGAAIWYAASDRAWWRTVLILAVLLVVSGGSSGILPPGVYRGVYVAYMLKTLPLIPLWIVMQAELWLMRGVPGEPIRASERPETGQLDAAGPQAAPELR